MRGYPTTRQARERVWRLVHDGHRRFSELSHMTGLSPITVRDIVLDGCGELWQRIERDRQHAKLDELSDPH